MTKLKGNIPPNSKSIDDSIYFNDEWNGQWIKDPKKEVDIIEVEKEFRWFNPVHWLYEMYSQGKISKQELELKLKNL